MSIRDFANENPHIIYGAVIGAVVLFFVVDMFKTDPESIPTFGQVTFYDPIAKKSIAVRSSTISPYEKDGVTYYKARQFSCSECTADSPVFIGYLERYTPKTVDLLVNDPENPDLVPLIESDGIEYAIIESGDAKLKWTNNIATVVNHTKSKCDTGLPVPCTKIVKSDE